jgi:hypothetical protein
MKTRSFIPFFILALYPAMFVTAQAAPTEDTWTNLAFVISVDANTNVFKSNDGVGLLATINTSSVSIAKREEDGTFLSITNRNGDAYHFSLMRSDYNRLLLHTGSGLYALLPNKDYGWPLSFGPNDDIEGKRLVPGEYSVQATCEFYVCGQTNGPESTNRVVSNSLRIILK